MFTNTPINTPANWLEPSETQEAATEQKVELHVTFSDGTDDWYAVGDPQDSVTLSEHLAEALEQGHTWTVERIVSAV